MTTSEQAANAEITCNEDGPYIIKNVNHMTDTKGQPIATKSTMALCRCGESLNKPFCDGTHSKVGFSSKDPRDAVKNKKRSYAGEKITVHDNRGLCAHAGVCIRELNAVFSLKKSPWIDPDQASVDEVMAVVDDCPSGALSYTIENQQPKIPPSQTSITVIPSGPYKIVGEIEMADVQKFEGACDTTRTLCRCGHSKNKPYCDGAHLNSGFEDA